MREIKPLIYAAIFITLTTMLTGCKSTGDIKTPSDPIGSLKETDKETATVIFYDADEGFTFDNTDELFFVLHSNQDLESEEVAQAFVATDTGLSHYIGANKEYYMSKEFKPGVHTFDLKLHSRVVARLEAGKTYYLAKANIAHTIVTYIEFRTQDDFIKETKKATQVKLKEKSCGFWSIKCRNFTVIE